MSSTPHLHVPWVVHVSNACNGARVYNNTIMHNFSTSPDARQSRPRHRSRRGPPTHWQYGVDAKPRGPGPISARSVPGAGSAICVVVDGHERKGDNEIKRTRGWDATLASSGLCARNTKVRAQRAAYLSSTVSHAVSGILLERWNRGRAAQRSNGGAGSGERARTVARLTRGLVSAACSAANTERVGQGGARRTTLRSQR